MFTITPFEQGKLTIITGPVKSEKTRRLEAKLDAAHDGKLVEKEPFLIIKHPKDDPKQPDRIGKHKAHSLEKPDDISKLVDYKYRHIVIAGISHYEDRDIVALVDALVRSNRNVIASALNLDSGCKPYNHMPDLMSLADEVILTKAICKDNECKRGDAIRSIEVKKGEGVFEPRCLHHYNYVHSPGTTQDRDGTIEIFAGPMFSGKSVMWSSVIDRQKERNIPYVVFTFIDNTRYGSNQNKRYIFGEGVATLNNGQEIKALFVKNAEDIMSYLSDHPNVRDVFIDEAQFLDIEHAHGKEVTPLYTVISNLSAEGRRFYLTGLHRNFKREKFFEMPELMCLATHIEMSTAYCVYKDEKDSPPCGHPATENQMLKLASNGEYVPANYDDDPVAIGGAKQKGDKPQLCYEARCLKHFKLPNAPTPKYEFPEWLPRV